MGINFYPPDEVGDDDPEAAAEIAAAEALANELDGPPDSSNERVSDTAGYSENDFVVFLGGASYVQQFDSLTANIPDEKKIIFYNSQNVPAIFAGRGGVNLIYYPSSQRTWNYQAAMIF